MTWTGFTLDGKVALVTGGGRGLGYEIARAFAGAGASVLINGRTHETLERAVTAILSSGDSAVALPFDVTDAIAVEEAFKEIRQRYGRLDILVNNVGVRDVADYLRSTCTLCASWLKPILSLPSISAEKQRGS